MELGSTQGAKRIVTKGPKQGERVVVGVQAVKSGSEVKPIEPAEAGKHEAAPKPVGKQ